MDTKKLRQKILDLAIHGRLVPQDPADEPASALLEHIKAEKGRLVKEGKMKRNKETAKTSDAPRYEDAPFEIPGNWVWTTGSEIFLPLRSCTPQGDTFTYIDIDAIDNKLNIINNPKIVRTTDAPSRATRYTKAGDVLFSMVRPYLKNIAIVPKDGWIASTGFFVCSPSKMLLSQYCYYLMLSDYVVNGLNQYMKGDNSPSINNSHLTSWLYPLPPLAEQQRIVAEIERWFSLIGQIEQGKAGLQAAIKQAKSKILDLAIHGRLVPQDPADEPASALLERIKAEKGRLVKEGKMKRGKETAKTSDAPRYPYLLPKGWAWCKLEDILQLISGQDFPPERYNDKSIGIPYIIGASNIERGLLQVNRWTDSPSVISNKGDLLIVCKGGVGKMAINDIGNVHIARQIQAIRDFAHVVNIKYIKAVISYNIDNVVSMANGLIPGIERGLLLSLLFPLPPLAEQQRIVRKVEELFSALDNIQKALEA